MQQISTILLPTYDYYSTCIASLVLWRHLFMAPRSRFFRPTLVVSSTPCKTKIKPIVSLTRSQTADIFILSRRDIFYLVSLSAAWQWSSWAGLSTDTESRSQPKCRALWLNWGSWASLTAGEKSALFFLQYLPYNRQNHLDLLPTLFMANTSIWLFLRLKSFWTSLKAKTAPSKSPVAPWHATTNTTSYKPIQSSPNALKA